MSKALDNKIKLNDIVDVKTFGAKGDGVTDDTAAISAAIAANVGAEIFFPAGTYVVASQISLPSNVVLRGESERTIIKLASQNWGVSSGLMFALSLDTDVEFNSLVFDGNKGNVGTTRSPLIVVFKSQRVSFKNCTFQNVEGICLNLSTNIDDLAVEDCKFLSCGGNPNNSDGYRKQAIAFSSDNVDRSNNIKITGNYFYRQGLDCISLNDCDNVVIGENISLESYTLVYNVPAPSYSTNVNISGNVVRTCSEFGAGTAVAPAALDLPNVKSLTVVGNSIYDVDACGIGLFTGTENAIVSGNTVINPMRNSPNFLAGICLSSSIINALIEGNLIVDTGGVPLMRFGITVRTTAANVLMRDNVIRNPLTGRYGYYSTATADVANTFTVTSVTQVSSSTRIDDLDIENNLSANYGRLSVQASHATAAAMTVTQLGAGPALLVEDSASPDATPFVVDASGRVIIGNTTPFSASTLTPSLNMQGTGSVSGPAQIGLNAFSADIGGPVMYFGKSRGAVGAAGIVAADDFFGALFFEGSDGTAQRRGAAIAAYVDGTPGASDMPGRLVLSTTPDGSATTVERMRIDNAGNIITTAPTTAPALTTNGTMVMNLTSNTNLRISVRGSDGVTRVANITLA